MTAIRAPAQLARRALERGSLYAAQAQRHLDSIVASSGRLEALLSKLLDVSPMRLAGPSASLEWMDLAALSFHIFDWPRVMALVRAGRTVARMHVCRTGALAVVDDYLCRQL